MDKQIEFKPMVYDSKSTFDMASTRGIGSLLFLTAHIPAHMSHCQRLPSSTASITRTGYSIISIHSCMAVLLIQEEGCWEKRPI